MMERKFRSNNKLVFTAGWLLFLMLTGGTGTVGWLTNFLLKQFSWGWQVREKLSKVFIAPVDYLMNKTTLIEENRRLLSEQARWRRQLIVYQTVTLENQTLRGIFGKIDETAPPLVALVLAKPNQTPDNLMFIDLGAKNTVLPPLIGDWVAVDGIAVGRIVAVGDRISKVELLADAAKSLPVLVGEDGIPAVADGHGGGSFTIFLPRGLRIKNDDLVSAMTGDKLRPIGLVTHSLKKPTDAFQELIVSVPINIQQVTVVEIYDQE